MKVTCLEVVIAALTVSNAANVVITSIQQSEIETMQQELRASRHELFNHKLYVDQELVRMGLRK